MQSQGRNHRSVTSGVVDAVPIQSDVLPASCVDERQVRRQQKGNRKATERTKKGRKATERQQKRTKRQCVTTVHLPGVEGLAIRVDQLLHL